MSLTVQPVVDSASSGATKESSVFISAAPVSSPRPGSSTSSNIYSPAQSNSSPQQRPSSAKMPTRTIPFSRVMSSIDYRNMRFVVFDCPTETTLPLYLEELKSRNVTDVVRVCEPTYDRAVLEDNGVKLFDWPFPDGSIPPVNIIQGFLQLCDERFPGGISGASSFSGEEGDVAEPAIGVHCVAGLGRAPVLVAIALIESGMAPLDAVELVRRRRRGAFNSVQLSYLVDSYKRMWKKGASNKLGGLLSKRSVSPNGVASAGSKVPGVVVGSANGPTAEDNVKTAVKSGFLMNKVFGGFKKA